jgi:hypothetical protein
MTNWDVIEGNLRAVYDEGGPGIPNMWTLHIKSTDNRWISIQWLGVGRIQELFNTKLPKK